MAIRAAGGAREASRASLHLSPLDANTTTRYRVLLLHQVCKYSIPLSTPEQQRAASQFLCLWTLNPEFVSRNWPPAPQHAFSFDSVRLRSRGAVGVQVVRSLKGRCLSQRPRAPGVTARTSGRPRRLQQALRHQKAHHCKSARVRNIRAREREREREPLLCPRCLIVDSAFERSAAWFSGF